ncbi:MAG: DUF1926 domain-containing protein, partial [Candidatus Eisenbacteria bacterium]|nr:DUF1926 domain-containing protein [Candidatus Eisenbacteria bacterium]
RGFMMRYPESNRLHKRMLRASRRLHAVVDRDRAWKEARTRLWRAQCNCPYWHGVFGGLYLPHLREAVYRELIAVERWVAPGLPHVEFGDFDLDGDDDALIETHDWAAWVSARGGALWALDDRRRGRNWGDTLARRPEAYHEALEQALVGGGEGASIHRAIRSREAGLSDLAKRQDERPRDMFLERWIDAGKEAGGAELGKSAGAALRAGGPAGVPGTFSYSSERFRFVESGSHEIVLAFPEGDAPGMLKRYRVDERGALTAGIELSSSRARSGSLEVTLGLGVHVPEAPDRFMCVNGARARPAHFAARSSHDRVRELSLVDLCDRTKLDVTIDRDARLERDPIETVSLSEAGAERVFQGLEARFSFDVAIEPGASWSVQFTLSPGGAME